MSFIHDAVLVVGLVVHVSLWTIPCSCRGIRLSKEDDTQHSLLVSGRDYHSCGRIAGHGSACLKKMIHDILSLIDAKCVIFVLVLQNQVSVPQMLSVDGQRTEGRSLLFFVSG